MNDVYLPSLETYIYYAHYISILSNIICGRLWHDTYYFKPKNICTIRDYSEKMYTNVNLEIQSEHIGNGRSLSKKGNNIEIVDKELNDTCAFHSYLSNDNCQDASTTHTHIIYMLEEWKNYHLKNRCSIWESTDGYCKQYRCGAALFFKSIISVKSNVIVDCIIGAPGYEKDVVDGINSCNKRYLMG